MAHGRSRSRRNLPLLAAWSVHALTASGAVLGVAALLLLQRAELHGAALCMLAALAIDSVDGTLARRLRVAERVPWIDGRRLDDVVDYLNYAVVPAIFLYRAGSLAHPSLVALPVLASAYGFAQRDAKTEDDFFLGFPSYWNVLAVYLWLLQWPPGPASALVVLLAAAVFVPWKYVYPSRMPVLRRTTAAAAALWAVMLAAAVIAPEPARRLHLPEVSLLFPAYYLLLSLRLGGLHRRPPASEHTASLGVPEAGRRA